jgi:hypothetical protein
LSIEPIYFHREGRDVVIKVIAKGEDGNDELQILQFLNSEPLRSDPANATVPVLEFLTYDGWKFAVMPHWGSCDYPPMKNVAECLEFADQILSVSLVFYFLVCIPLLRVNFRV